MTVVQRIERQLAWHRSRVDNLTMQLSVLRCRPLHPLRRQLRRERLNHQKTIKLLERL